MAPDERLGGRDRDGLAERLVVATPEGLSREQAGRGCRGHPVTSSTLLVPSPTY